MLATWMTYYGGWHRDYSYKDSRLISIKGRQERPCGRRWPASMKIHTRNSATTKLRPGAVAMAIRSTVGAAAAITPTKTNHTPKAKAKVEPGTAVNTDNGNSIHTNRGKDIASDTTTDKSVGDRHTFSSRWNSNDSNSPDDPGPR